MSETHITESTTTETHEVVQPEERQSSLLSDILTIVGFAILFIIIIWGLIHLVELIASSFSGDFGKPAPTIQVNAPAQTTSGTQATISWNYSPGVEGSYAFLYQCESGLTYKMQESTSTAVAIPCGTSYTTASTNNSIVVTPTLSATSTATDTVSIVFIPSHAGSQVQGDATMTIVPAVKTTAPAKTTTKTTTYVSGSSSSNTGPAELAVSIISGNINQYGDGTVTFNIANVGGSTSASYYFSAELPTAQPYPYQSPLQAPLAPGAHVVSTLNFTDARSGGGLFSVTIEGGNVSSDYASMEIPGPTYNGYNSGNNTQPYVQYPTYTY